MKKYFITGLVILLPLAVTIGILYFIINFFTQPFVGPIEQQLLKIPGWAPYQHLIHFTLQILLLFVLFFVVVVLGFLTRIILFKYLFGLYDRILHKIPVIKTIYKASQQVIKTLFGSSSRSFKQVVMVPFPVRGAWAIGLLSSSCPSICEKALGMELISVYVPTTPNPTSGYLMLYKPEDVVYIDMKIEDALKYCISCGLITAEEAVPGDLGIYSHET